MVLRVSILHIGYKRFPFTLKELKPVKRSSLVLCGEAAEAGRTPAREYRTWESDSRSNTKSLGKEFTCINFKFLSNTTG